MVRLAKTILYINGQGFSYHAKTGLKWQVFEWLLARLPTIQKSNKNRMVTKLHHLKNTLS
jgi:hypothetical protein